MYFHLKMCFAHYFIHVILNNMSDGKMLHRGNFERTQTLKRLEGTLPQG